MDDLNDMSAEAFTFQYLQALYMMEHKIGSLIGAFSSSWILSKDDALKTEILAEALRDH